MLNSLGLPSRLAGQQSALAPGSLESRGTTLGAAGFDPLVNPRFGLTFLAWQVLLWFALHTCWQTTAMRMFSTKGPEVSKRVMSWTGFIFLGRGMMPMLWGIAALTMFGTGPVGRDGVPMPVFSGRVIEPLEAMPAMLAQILGSGLHDLKGINFPSCGSFIIPARI
jgi:hypothetical protein